MTNRVHPLSVEAAATLKQLFRQTKEAVVRSRCEMILLSAEGLSPPQISERVRYSARTVRRVIQRYEAEGVAGLGNKPIPGRPARVTPRYLAQLEEVVEQMPRDLGLPYSNWSTDNLSQYMGEQTGIQIGARQMENYLKKYRWRLRRPTTSVRHLQNPEQVEEKKKHPPLPATVHFGADSDVW